MGLVVTKESSGRMPMWYYTAFKGGDYPLSYHIGPHWQKQILTPGGTLHIGGSAPIFLDQTIAESEIFGFN